MTPRRSAIGIVLAGFVAAGALSVTSSIRAEPAGQPGVAPAGREDRVVEPRVVDVDSALGQARDLMGRLEYEKAIALLEPVLEATRFRPERLQETYLLLIEAHVYGGNRSAAGSKEQQLWYKEAREMIRECLGVRELRHTLPDPPDRYPAEMLQFFDDVRREIFGSFEITRLIPSDARVLFDGETLLPDPDGVHRWVDVPVGEHLLVIRHPGYEHLTEDVQIGPSMLVTRSPVLRRRKGLAWYATRMVAPVAAAIGIAVGVAGSRGAGTEPPRNLPGPPAPPNP